jgi:hypothetical protein
LDAGGLTWSPILPHTATQVFSKLGLTLVNVDQFKCCESVCGVCVYIYTHAILVVPTYAAQHSVYIKIPCKHVSAVYSESNDLVFQMKLPSSYWYIYTLI